MRTVRNESVSGIFWLASYPKSGNTWLRLALESLRTGGAAVDLTAKPFDAPIASSRRLFDTLLQVESSDLTMSEIEALRPRVYQALIEASKSPLLCKIHDAWTLTPSGEPLFSPRVTSGVVYIVRDPRDVAVSLAHHSGITVDRAIEILSDPDWCMGGGGSLSRQFPQRLLGWSGHATSWLDTSGLDSILLRYEDMLADPHCALTRIADYLGWTVSDEALSFAIAATRFEVLQAAEERQGFKEKPASAERFFRRGVAGGWRDTLTHVQVDRIEKDHEPVMIRLGYLPAR